MTTSRIDRFNLLAPPETFPADTVWPNPLQPGPTPQAWDIQRAQIRDHWQGILGPWPEACDLAIQVTDDQDAGSHRRLKLRYQVEPAVWVEAFLLIPHGLTAPAPAVAVFHPTTVDTIYEVAGLKGRPSRFNGVHFVEAGYVVICPENYLWQYLGERVTETEGAVDRFKTHTERLLATHPGWTGLGKMIWDCRRAIDVLVNRPEVDAARIGCFGMSLGAKEALYLPAFDERIKASVSSDGGIGLPYSNWDAPWYLGEQVNETGFAGDHHEVLSLIAPRAFCLMGSTGGISEDTGEWIQGYDGERSWPYIAAALPVWELHGKRDHLGILSHRHGHSIPRIALDLTLEWLRHFL